MMRMVTVMSRTHLPRGDLGGSLWRQWRRQPLAPVCVLALYSGARGRLVTDFGLLWILRAWAVENVKKKTQADIDDCGRGGDAP